MEAKKVNPEKIKSGNINPREDLKNLDELTENIRYRKELGQRPIYTPLMVREIEDENFDYEIIDGKRRLQASLMNRLTEVPVVLETEVKNKEDLVVASLISNEFREDFSWKERGIGYKELHDSGLSYSEISKRVGSSKTRIATHVETLEKIQTQNVPSTERLNLETLTEILVKCPEQDVAEVIEFVIKNKVSLKDVRKVLFALRNFYASLEALKDFYPELHAELVSVYYPHRFNPKAISLYEQEELLRTGRTKPIIRFLDIKDFPTTKSAIEYASKYHGKIVEKVTRSGWQITMIPYTKEEVRHKLKKLVEQT